MKTTNKFKKLAKKYDFTTTERINLEKENTITLEAVDTRGEKTDWIRYNITTDTVSLIGNTDHINIWLYKTRPDLTPERVITFVDELSDIFRLSSCKKQLMRTLIDPEDWQEIANIHDAYQDIRYGG